MRLRTCSFLNILVCFLALVSIGCTTTSSKSSFSNKTNDIKLIKEVIDSYAKGDLQKYRGFFTVDAKIYHNRWPSVEKALSVDEIIAIHQQFHNQLSKPIEITNAIYEVITTAEGDEYGHAWVRFNATFKKGGSIQNSVFVSFAIEEDRKISMEWGLYDTSQVPTYIH